MNVKASARSALIVAAGFWMCLAGPLQAAEDGGVAASTTESAAGPPVALSKFTKKSRHWKRVSSHRKSRIASTASRANAKTAAKNKATAAATTDDNQQSAIPPSVANAHAQLAADLPVDTDSVSTKASDMLRTMAAKQLASADQEVPAPAAAAELVSADELNDVDRALSDAKSDDKDKAPAATLAMAMAQAPAQTQAAVVSADDSAWNQTSLIGKIFIAFGGLLTLASAARMFMA